ncbi:MAG: hypothetical protein AAF431_16975 [Pseudomonadota bacterium]
MSRSTTTRVVAASLGFVLIVITGVSHVHAKENKSFIDKVFDGAIDGAVSFGVEVALNAIASGLYLGYCGDDQVVDDAGEFICSVIGDVSGDNDAKWRAGVDEKLDQIEERLEGIENGQKAIESALETQFDWIRKLIEELPERARVHDDLVNIDTAWVEFTDMFDDVRDFGPEKTRQHMRKVARSLLQNTKFNVAASAKDLRVAITTGHAGLKPLPMMLAEEISRRIRVPMKDKDFWDFSDPKDFDIRPHYAQLELALQRWMVRQRQAQIMTLFAERALSDDGTINDSASEFYGKSYFRGLEKQLESYQRAVEWLVLGHSFPRSPFANFLPNGAEEVFQRADALQAIYLASPGEKHTESRTQALWGRVISMGSAAGEAIVIKMPGVTDNSEFKATKHTVPFNEVEQLDWWSASEKSKPESFDTVHFAKNWTVYRFKISLMGKSEGDHGLTAKGGHWPLLNSSTTVDNSLSEITGMQTLFGSFLGIGRAGGGYALFSGDYEEKQTNTLHSYVNKRSLGPASPQNKYAEIKTQHRTIDRTRGTMPRLSLVEQGTTNLVKAKNFGANIPFEVVRNSRITLINHKRIRPATGGQKLEFNVLWNEDDLEISSVKQKTDRVIVAKNNWQQPFLASPGKAKFNAHFAINFGDRKNNNPPQSISVDKSGENTEPVEQHVSRKKRHHDKEVFVFGKQGEPLELVAITSFESTRYADQRVWTMVARGALQTAYFTPVAAN